MDSPSVPRRMLRSRCAASEEVESARLSSPLSWVVLRLSLVLMTVLGRFGRHLCITQYLPRGKFVDEIAKLFGRAVRRPGVGDRVADSVAVGREARRRMLQWLEATKQPFRLTH